MLENTLNFDLAVEILYSYIYEKDMTFEKIDQTFKLPNKTAEAILGICNIFRDCGFKMNQGKCNIPMQSICKLARVNLSEISNYFDTINYSTSDNKTFLTKLINERKYSREIKNAILKTAYDTRFSELQNQKEELQYIYLKESIKRTLKAN